MSDALFGSVEQALHISFLVLSMEARQKAPLAQMLRRVLEELPYLTKAQAKMLEYLGGATACDYVSEADRLSMDEFRGQCAMVADQVEKVLPGPEAQAVWLRWGITTGSEGEKTKGVLGMQKYISPLLRISDVESIQALLYGRTNERWRTAGLSYEDISKARGISVASLRRAAAIINSTTRALEEMAVNRLRPTWERDGLVEESQTEFA